MGKRDLNNLGIYKNGAVKLSNVVDINNGNKKNLPVPMTIEKPRISQRNIEIKKNIQDSHASVIREDSTILNNLEILERLGQIEIMHSKELNPVWPVKDRS